MSSSLNREPGFYKAPVAKSLLVLTSASSFLHSLNITRSYYQHYPVLLVVRVWSLPSLGVWLAAALILYQYRIVERRRGSSNFMSHVVLSGTLSMALFSVLVATRHKTGLPFTLIPGALVYSLVGLLTLEYMATISPSRPRLGGLPISSNFPLYILASLFSASSVSSLALAASGLLGGLLVRAAGVSLPRPPSWMTSALGEVFAKDPPPKNYSGASLSVQAQQRTDEIEQLMATMYTRQQQRQARRMVISRPIRQELPPPPEEQVEQLLAMGFSRQECVQALQHTGNNVEIAIQLLTARRT